MEKGQKTKRKERRDGGERELKPNVSRGSDAPGDDATACCGVRMLRQAGVMRAPKAAVRSVVD